jgi:hypothetical protein
MGLGLVGMGMGEERAVGMKEAGVYYLITTPDVKVLFRRAHVYLRGLNPVPLSQENMRS